MNDNTELVTHLAEGVGLVWSWHTDQIENPSTINDRVTFMNDLKRTIGALAPSSPWAQRLLKQYEIMGDSLHVMFQYLADRTPARFPSSVYYVSRAIEGDGIDETLMKISLVVAEAEGKEGPLFVDGEDKDKAAAAKALSTLNSIYTPSTTTESWRQSEAQRLTNVIQVNQPYPEYPGMMIQCLKEYAGYLIESQKILAGH